MKSRSKGIVTVVAVVCMLFFMEFVKEEHDKPREEEITEQFIVPEIVYDELLFKESCEELVYNEIGEESIGKYVTKELTCFEWYEKKESGENIYTCAATEDLGTLGRTYRVYKMEDCRFYKHYKPQYTDVFRIYGMVEDTFFCRGGESPTIRVYYADYVRQYGEEVENAKELSEVIADREREAQEIAESHATVSDFTGETKNIDGMWELPLEEYIKYCDSMCVHDITGVKSGLNSGYESDLKGLHAKLRVRTSSLKKFAGAGYKLEYMDKWGVEKALHDDVWYSVIYNEFTEDYNLPSASYVTLFFHDGPEMDVSSFEKDKEVVVYGQIVEYKKIDSFSKDVEILVRYYEEK